MENVSLLQALNRFIIIKVSLLTQILAVILVAKHVCLKS